MLKAMFTLVTLLVVGSGRPQSMAMTSELTTSIPNLLKKTNLQKGLAAPLTKKVMNQALQQVHRYSTPIMFPTFNIT